jgi:hypothetical protein
MPKITLISQGPLVPPSPVICRTWWRKRRLPRTGELRVRDIGRVLRVKCFCVLSYSKCSQSKPQKHRLSETSPYRQPYRIAHCRVPNPSGFYPDESSQRRSFNYDLVIHLSPTQAFFRKQVFSTRPFTFSALHSISSGLPVRRMFLIFVPRLSVTDVPFTGKSLNGGYRVTLAEGGSVAVTRFHVFILMFQDYLY